MRRAATVLGGLVMAGSLTLGLSGSAWASQGTLEVSGNTYSNPGKGCYTGKFWPLVVNNRTNTPVFIFEDGQCQGQSLGTVSPESSRVFDFGQSVYVPQ
jgi:hypothetical protein